MLGRKVRLHDSDVHVGFLALQNEFFLQLLEVGVAPQDAHLDDIRRLSLLAQGGDDVRGRRQTICQVFRVFNVVKVESFFQNLRKCHIMSVSYVKHGKYQLIFAP